LFFEVMSLNLAMKVLEKNRVEFEIDQVGIASHLTK
jgi:hypothetical protein